MHFFLCRMVLLRSFADDSEATAFLEGLPHSAKTKIVDHLCEILLEDDAADVASTSGAVDQTIAKTSPTIENHSVQAKELTRGILRALTFTPDLFLSYFDVSKFTVMSSSSAAEQKDTKKEKEGEASPTTQDGDTKRKRRRGKGDTSPAAPSKKKKVDEEEGEVEGKDDKRDRQVVYSSHHIRRLTLVLEMLQPRVSDMQKNESLVPHLFKVLRFFVQDKPAATTDNGTCILSLCVTIVHIIYLLLRSLL